MELKENVSIDSIEVPERSEKLHPYQDEDPDEEENSNEVNTWEQFRDSVGTEPDNPPTVIENGDGFVLVDGDRRMRALQENDAKTVDVLIRDDVDTTLELFEKRLTANEFRKGNNKKQRSWYVAQFVAPSLLPPGERKLNEGEEIMSQAQFARELAGRGEDYQGRISVWLQPMKDEHPLRATLQDKASGRKPDWDDITTIDRIMDLLKGRGEAKNVVVIDADERFTASELADMEGVSLSELETCAEKAANNKWNHSRFLEYINENYAYDDIEEPDGVDSGMMDGSDPFEDNDYGNDTPERKDGGSTGVSVDDVEVDDGSGGTEDRVQYERPNIEVDWGDHVDDEDLNGASLAELKTRRMMGSEPIEDEAAVAINIVSAKTGLSLRETKKMFAEPAIVDRCIEFLNDGELPSV